MKEAVSKKIIPYMLAAFLLVATVIFLVFVGGKNPAEEMRAAELERRNKEVSQLPDSNPDDARARLALAERELREMKEREERALRDRLLASQGNRDDEARRVARNLNVDLPRAPGPQMPATDPGLSSKMVSAHQDAGSANAKIGSFEDYDDAKQKQRAAQGGQPAATSQDRTASASRSQQAELKNQPAEKPSLPKMPASSDYLLAEGSVIRTVFVTGVNSQNPGKVIVRVTEDVYDSIRGVNLLIPRGTQITGSYTGEVKAGMDRIPIAFTRMIFPDGRSATLPKMPAVTRTGEVGADGEYHSNLLRSIIPSLLVGLAGVVVDTISQKEIAASGGELTNDPRANPAESVGGKIFPDVAKRLGDRYTDAKPYFTIQPGEPFMVMVTADFAIPPMEGNFQ